ncbi:hypothetical protein C8Q73DRAFT_795740 [Cubamyces lactineus]|nr:hypothetical protein C8Q73DRAFT_795740 [Cubamyces lactineus]
MLPKYALKTVLYIGIQSVIGDNRRAAAGRADFDMFIRALVEIGFTIVEGPNCAGITLRPPLGLKGAQDNLFVG